MITADALICGKGSIAGCYQNNVAWLYLAGEPTILDAVCAGIDRAVAHDRLTPLDREKGVFTSDIHLLDELSVAQLSRTHLNAGAVTMSPGRDGLPAVDAYSDAASQLAQARPTLVVLSGVGGASVNRARVVAMARAQGREARVLTADRTSQAYLQQASELGEGAVLTRPSLVSETLFAPNSTLVVDLAEKLTLKETVTLLDGALRNNVQLVLMDTEKRKGTGNALAVMKDAGVPRFQFSGRLTVRTLVASEPDKAARFAQLAGSYAKAVREALKDAGLLGHEEKTVAVLTPVWLDRKNRSAGDTYSRAT